MSFTGVDCETMLQRGKTVSGVHACTYSSCTKMVQSRFFLFFFSHTTPLLCPSKFSSLTCIACTMHSEYPLPVCHIGNVAIFGKIVHSSRLPFLANGTRLWMKNKTCRSRRSGPVPSSCSDESSKTCNTSVPITQGGTGPDLSLLPCLTGGGGRAFTPRGMSTRPVDKLTQSSVPAVHRS